MKQRPQILSHIYIYILQIIQFSTWVLKRTGKAIHVSKKAVKFKKWICKNIMKDSYRQMDRYKVGGRVEYLF